MILKYLRNRIKYRNILFLAFGTIMLLESCNRKQSLDEIIIHEKERGVKYDSLFHGLYFGMKMKSFYDHCFDMNQKGLFFQNGFNLEVIIKYEKEFSAPVDFVFFPKGPYQTIEKIEGSFMFQHWTPFTKEHSAAVLLEEVIDKMQEWYPGRDFIQIDDPNDLWPYAYAKVDGNRKIVLYRSFDDQKVHAVFENLDEKFPIVQANK
ncbi:hypothetical protein C7972_11760 [Arenibacter sp. ARW7G5Y1]|nr:hypothetical protein C7972_11760 [Arenibacter sp. ARW7G5Y1]|tara:strand:- start:54374 stop:54991 length:618 start_codon:yes stop_codon:yes gene_type:complete